MILFFILFAFALVSYFKPTFAVGLILALTPTYLLRYSISGFPTTFLELILGIFLVITFLSNLKRLAELKHLGAVNWWVLLFVVAGLIATAVSPEKTKALGELKAFIIEPVLFFYACRLVIKNLADLKIPLNLMFLGAGLVSIFGIIQHFTLIDLPLQFWGTGEEVLRITSFFDYPNALALYLAPLASFFLAMLLSGERVLNKKNLFVGLVLILVALYFTFSRGAWLGFLAAAAAVILLRYSLKKSAILIGVIVITVLVLPQTRMRLQLISKDASSSAHLELMAAAVTKLKQSPIIGNGLYGFRTTLSQQHFSGEILNYPHNIFLNFWIEMGLIGLIAFLAIVITAGWQYKLNPTWYRLAGGAFLLALIIHGQFDVPYFKNDLSVLFWFVISTLYVTDVQLP